MIQPLLLPHYPLYKHRHQREASQYEQVPVHHVPPQSLVCIDRYPIHLGHLHHHRQ